MTAPPRAAKFLESALLFTFVMHGLAMIAMVVLLLPGLPGGSSASAAERILYVASHPWLWRAGWLGFQLAAVSDLLLAIALVKDRQVGWSRYNVAPCGLQFFYCVTLGQQQRFEKLPCGRAPKRLVTVLSVDQVRRFILMLAVHRSIIAVHTTARERRQPLPAHNRQIPPSRHLRLINTSRIHRPSTPGRATAPGKSPRTFSRQHEIHLIQSP